MPSHRGALKVLAATLVVALGTTAIIVTRPTPPKYQLARAQPEAVTSTVNGVGTLAPTTNSVIAPPMNGTVTSIVVNVGQTVTAGETLATISPSAQASQAKITDESALAQAEAALAQAEQSTNSPTPTTASASSPLQSEITAAQHTLAELCPTTQSPNSATCHSLTNELNQISSQSTAKTSSAHPTNSSASISASTATIAADQAIVTADQSALNSAQQIQSGALVSPISGTVATLPLTIGQVVRALSTSDAITVIQPDNVEVVVPISISTAKQLHNGDRATVVPLGTSHAIDGQVDSVGTTPTTNQATGTTTVSVVVSLDHPSLPIFDGAQARVTIEVAYQKDVLAVPTSAITYTNGRTAVLVNGPRGATSRAVEIGIMGSQYTAIRSGLTNGTSVVLATLSKPLPAPTRPLGAFGKIFKKGKAG
ncbi:MAG: efflux RND transporter periplasmic adaptor subunit [Ferrimicrobium sp.]